MNRLVIITLLSFCIGCAGMPKGKHCITTNLEYKGQNSNIKYCYDTSKKTESGQVKFDFYLPDGSMQVVYSLNEEDARRDFEQGLGEELN